MSDNGNREEPKSPSETERPDRTTPRAPVEDTPVASPGMQELDVDDALLKRLHSLQRPTWELELFISGAVVFSLFQLPGRLRGWFETIEPHVGRDVGMMPFMAFYCLTLVAICLAVAFSLHFVLRSVWVGLTGLRSVFPKGIEWDKLDIGPVSKAVAREMNPDLRSAEERVDRIASSIFAVLFALLIVLVVAFSLIMVPMFLVEMIRTRFFPEVSSQLTWFVVIGLVALPSLPVAALDAWFKKDLTRVERYPRLFARTLRGSRLIQRFFLAGLSSPILLTLSSRWSWKRVNGGLVAALFLSVAIFLGYFVSTAGILGFDSYVFYPQKGGSAVLSSEHYEDQRRPGNSSRVPTLPSEVIETPLARLFIPFLVGRDAARVLTECPEDQPNRLEGFFLRGRLKPDDKGANEGRLRCVRDVYVVSIDGQEVEGEWAFAQHATNKLKGLVGYLPLDGLALGRHELMVARRPSEGELTYSLEPQGRGNPEVPGQGQPRNPEEEAVTVDGPELDDPLGAVSAQGEKNFELAYRDRYTILFWKAD